MQPLKIFESIGDYSWYLIAVGALLVGFAVGFLLGRLRTNWRLESILEEGKQAVEWERGERKKLIKQAMYAAEAAEERVQDAKDMAEERIAVLQKELQRLYTELQRDWRAHAEEEKQIHRLEARIKVLSEKVGIIDPDETASSVRHLAAGDDKVLTLWNTTESASLSEQDQEPDETPPKADQ
jgi:hypothetical protein